MCYKIFFLKCRSQGVRACDPCEKKELMNNENQMIFTTAI